MDAAQVRQLIQTAFPQLAVERIRPFGAGWANATWLVDEAIVFRFPKNRRAAEATLREIAVLPMLVPTLPLPVPDFRFPAPHGAADHQLPFAGYTLVPGLPVSEAPDMGRSAALAPAVGAFLTVLHRFPVAQAAALGVPGGTPEQWRAEYATMHEELRQLCAPLLTQAEQAQMTSVFERFLQDDRHFAFRPVLLHRDLGEEHLLIDQNISALSGVIDFEDMSIGDPAFDLIGVAQLGQGVVDAYGGPTDVGFAARMRFYTWLWPLHELRYGIEAGLIEHQQRGLQRLRAALVAPPHLD